MACLPYAPGMAAALALHVRNLPDYDKQLHVLYLANDILLKRYVLGLLLHIGVTQKVTIQTQCLYAPVLPCYIYVSTNVT